LAETRKLSAILVADVVGYSRHTGTDEDRTWALRSDRIDPTISVHHGRVVKSAGDGALVEFRSVVDAVRHRVATGSNRWSRTRSCLARLLKRRRARLRESVRVGPCGNCLKRLGGLYWSGRCRNWVKVCCVLEAMSRFFS